MARERSWTASSPAERVPAPLTTTEAALLGLLSRSSGSGYELSKRIERGLAFIWAPARSGVYAVLPRLVAKGYASREDVPQTGRPDKQVYRLTRRGRAALREWLEEGPLESEVSKNPFLLKLFFGAEMRPEAVIELVRARKREAEETLARLRAIDREILALGPDREKEYFNYFTLKWGLEYYRALIRWADATLSELENRFG
jgi:PadR family transcriptional regulator, regulatory protein AphA